MPTQKEKIILIDKINDKFIKLQSNLVEKDYSVFLNKVQREIETLILTKDNVKSSDIKSIINSVGIPKTHIKRTIVMSLILSGITNVIENQRLDVQDKELLAPIIAFVGLYKLSADNLARKANNIVKAVLKNDKSILTANEQKGYKLVKGYIKQSTKIIEKQVKVYEKGLTRINKDIKTATSRKIFNEYNTLKRSTETQEQLSERLIEKFGETNKNRVKLIARTEIKRQVELVKQEQHIFFGYTHKRWNTQGDANVSLSHLALEGKTIPINKKFRIPAIDRKPSAWVMYPGDTSAPVGQVVNERCFLTYLKIRKK